MDQLDPKAILPARKFADQPKELVAVVGQPQEMHIEKWYRVVLSPDSGMLVVSDATGNAKLWDLKGNEPKELATINGKSFLYSFTIAADGKKLALGQGNGFIRIFDLDASPTERLSWRGHTPRIHGMAFTADGKGIYTGSSDNTVRLWDLSGSEPKERFQLRSAQLGDRGGQRVYSIDLSPDHKTLAAGMRYGGVVLWDINASPPQELAVLPLNSPVPHCLDFSPDGKLLAFNGGRDGTVRLWDLSNGKPRERALLRHGGADRAVFGVAFAPDGKTLAAADAGGHVVLWDVAGGTKRSEWKLPQLAEGVTFTLQGGHLAVATHDGLVYILRLLPVATGR